MDEFLGGLCIFAFVMAIVTVVGHGIWLVLAAVFRAIAGDKTFGAPQGKPCPHCRHPAGVVGGRCLACGRVPQVTPGVSLEQDLEATARHLRRLHDRKVISPEQFEQLMLAVRSDLARLHGEPVASPFAAPAAAEPVVAEVIEPAGSPAGITWVAPQRASPPPLRAKAPVAPRQAQPKVALPPARAQPVNIPPPKPVEPARPLSDVLQSFMEESNIRWGEIIAGLLIVVSAVGLIISLRATLKEIPYFPAMMFMLLTVSFYGAGMYTLRRWKLHAISRVILIISLLLVPLSFSAAIIMSGSGDMQKSVTDPLFIGAVLIGTLVFGLVTFTASSELAGEGKWRLTAAVLGTSIGQIVINRLGPGAVSLAQISLLTTLPLISFLVAAGGQVVRARGWRRLSASRANHTFLVLGIAAFSLAAPLSLLLHHAADRLLTLARLTPSLSIAAAAILAVGLVVHRRALARALSPHRTAGTAIAILGGLAMLGMVALAWPQPDLLLAVAIVNLVLLVLLAVAGNLPLLHGAAIACTAVACIVGLHLLQGRLVVGAASSLDLVQAALMGRTGGLLTILAAVAGALGAVLLKQKRREDGLVYLGGAAALGGISVLVASFCGLSPLGAWKEIPLDADLSAPLLLFYAVAFLTVGFGIRRLEPALAGSALLWAGLAQGLALNEALRHALDAAHLLPAHPVFIATLAHAAINILLAMVAMLRLLLASAPKHEENRAAPLWSSFVAPLALCAAGALLCATPFIFWAYEDQLAWHATYAGIAAVTWLGILLVLRQPAATYGVQAMLALCAGFIAANVMYHQLVGEHWYIQVRHLHVQIILVASGGILFALLRRLTRGNETIRSLLVTPAPAVDQVLLAVVVRTVPGLAIFSAWNGVWTELGALKFLPPLPLSEQMPIAAGIGGWLIVGAVLAALLVSLWERVTLPALMGIAVTLFAVPWLVATFWAEEHAVASAARWTTAILGLCGASVFIFRSQLHDLAQRIPGLSWGKLRWKAYYFTAWQPIVFAGGSILTITIAAVALQVKGIVPGGPDAGSIFKLMGTTASYAVPLFILVAILLGYCLRERQPLFAFGGSAVSQFAINLAFMLHVATPPKLTQAVYAAEWLQWNSIAAAVFGLAWLVLRRWAVKDPEQSSGAGLISAASTSKLLADLQLVVAGGTSLGLVVWSFGLIFLNPFASPAELAVLGSRLSYVAVALTAAVAIFDTHRQAARQAASVLPFAALAMISLVAASCDRLDNGSYWIAYHVLLTGSLVVAVLTTLASTLDKLRLPATASLLSPLSWLIPSHWVSSSIAALVAVLAIRGAYSDPQQPWWSVAAMAGVCLMAVVQGIIRRSQRYAYASLLAAPAAVILFWLGWPTWLLPMPDTFVVEVSVLAVSALCAIWLSLEIQSQRRENQPFDSRALGPGAHHAGIIACVAILAFRLCALTFMEAVEPTAQPLGRFVPSDLFIVAALVALTALVTRSLWERRAYFAVPIAYILGLLAIVDGLRHVNLQLLELALAFTVGIAVYVAITGHIWSFGANLADLGTRLGISDTVGGLKRTAYWLPAISIGITAAVCAIGLAAVFSHEQLSWRVATAFGPAIAAWGIACLAQQERKEHAQLAALLLAGLSAIYLAWAQLQPVWTEELVLERAFRLLMALSALTFIYGFALPRYLFTAGSWNAAARKSGYASGALAIVTFIAVLGLEVALFKPGIGAPVASAQVAAVAVVLVALVVGLLSLALLPGKDPLAMDEKGRMFYVYGVQSVSALLFAHLYVCRPMWFDSVLRPYWPYIVLALAFAGVAAGELFKRQNLRVLAEPFRRTGGLLPLIPALAMLVVKAPQADYAVVLFLASLMYLVLCIVHRSVLHGAAAALAGNAALWVLLDRGELRFLEHPQFWLIPPAASVLVASQLNRTRLSAEQLTATRYLATIVIYLSSTSEIFIHAAATDLWPPIILALLSIAGAMAGIMLRIRAFLYLGATFTLLALITMVWHAARAIEQTWPWWAFGFSMGIALLILFALFEKKKEEVKLLINRMRSWEQ